MVTLWAFPPFLNTSYQYFILKRGEPLRSKSKLKVTTSYRHAVGGKSLLPVLEVVVSYSDERGWFVSVLSLIISLLTGL